MDAETLLALARRPGAIALTPERAETLAAEIAATLAIGVEAARHLTFEDEPAGFVATLEALAPPLGDGA
ncbi:hypothetical protein [Acuticoccus sp.]|uniref:hypothetical protein n=1 Tax=Acuticoccus sp. TaxID=1904378 RepID=UPI003B52175C